MAALDKQIPWCTLLLVAATITCNILVLIGNLDASNAFGDIGSSTGGWSGVGLGAGNAVDEQLTQEMSNVSTELTNMIIKIETIQTEVDNLISVAGGAADDANSDVADTQKEIKEIHAKSRIEATRAVAPAGGTIDGVPAIVVDEAKTEVEKLLLKKFKATLKKAKAKIKAAMVPANEKLKELLYFATPALGMIINWTSSFGPQIMNGIQQFGTVLDKVQKIFDEIMQKMKGKNLAYKPYMLYNTFHLFAPEGTGGITEQDIQNVASEYQITALAGAKGESLFLKYDQNHDAMLDMEEYSQLVEDNSVPMLMSTVLRYYAKSLAGIAGQVGSATMRDEVAEAVVDYFQLVCVKNWTKVSWVSQRLTNNSVPMAFTATILATLVTSSSDTGTIVVNEMMKLNSTAVEDAYELLMSPGFWTEQGLTPGGQANASSTIAGWIADYHMSHPEDESKPTAGETEPAGDMTEPAGAKKLMLLASKVGSISSNEAAGMQLTSATDFVSLSRATVERRIKEHASQQRVARIERHRELMGTEGKRQMFASLLGGATASGAVSNPLVTQATNAGQPAAPSTLQFAKFLSWNATDQANTYQESCFNYTSTSSSQLDAFANEIYGFTNEVESFLTSIESYSTPAALAQLENQILEFAPKAENEIINLIFKEIEEEFDKLAEKVGLGKIDSMAMKHEDVEALNLMQSSSAPIDSTTVNSMLTTLNDLQSVLPTCITSLKTAKVEVTTVAGFMLSVFTIFNEKGVEVFDDIKSIYKYVWIAYFILLLPLQVGLLFYGFWASGFCGGPGATAEEEDLPPPPQTFRERCAACCSACCTCMSGCHDSQLCFWSFILLLQIFVVLLMIVAMVLCMLSGIQAFIGSGCDEVYMLNESGVCTEVMVTLKTFISSFSAAPGQPLEEWCSSKKLATCEVLAASMQSAIMLTTVFSFAGTILYYQLIVESAVLHERARLRRILSKMTKN